MARTISFADAYQRSFFKAWGMRLLGFGYQWKATVAWFIIIALSSFIACIIPWGYTTVSPDMAPLLWASFESILGILLINFLGFINANNIRNDS